MSLKNKIRESIYLLLNILLYFKVAEKASILMYHSVGENDLLFTVPPKNFLKQIDYLKKNNYRVLRFTELVEKIKNQERIESKTVVITFDDGYKDNYQNAFPLLEANNFPATIFLSTCTLGEGAAIGEGLSIRCGEVNKSDAPIAEVKSKFFQLSLRGDAVMPPLIPLAEARAGSTEMSFSITVTGSLKPSTLKARTLPSRFTSPIFSIPHFSCAAFVTTCTQSLVVSTSILFHAISERREKKLAAASVDAGTDDNTE